MAQHLLELLAMFLVCVCDGVEQNSIESSDPVCSPGPSPPHIKKLDSQEINLLREGKGAVIQCDADGTPAPTYQWFRDDVAIDDKGNYLKAFNNGTLVFKDFSYRDGGMFQCRAKNSFGTSVSVKVPIFANIDLGNKRENKEERVTVSQGQPFHLYCAHAPENSQDVRKYWYVDVKKYQVSPSSRVGVDTNGTLRMAYVVRNDSATYVCGVFPYIYSDSIIYIVDIVTVTVTEGNIGLMKPRKKYAPNVVKVTFGELAILECFFSGYPEPVITWKDKQQQVIQQGHSHYVIEDFGRKLRIEQVREDDEGTYSCTARNDAGSDDATIFLNVTCAPLMLTIPDYSLGKFFKLIGQMATLKCWARAMEGENLEPPVWYRNGELLTTDKFPDKTRYSFGECGTELTIRNLDKSTDTACFQCNISNSEGYIFYDGFLKVVGWDEIESS